MDILASIQRQDTPAWRYLVFTWLMLAILISFLNISVKGDDSSEIVDTESNCVLNNYANHAIRKARSDYCKNYLKEISCEINTNPNFFPSSLPRYCPIKNGNFGDLIGCVLGTTINITIFRPHKFNSSILCIDYCLKYAVSYAAYYEFTGQCNCWPMFDDVLAENIVAINRTCSNWFSDSNTSNSDDLLTLYRTGYAKIGNRFDKKIEPRPISLAFILLINGRKNVRQVKRLMRAIYSTEHYYIIHVDKNDDYLYRQISKLSDRYSNIVMSRKRYRTAWGAPTVIAAEFDIYKQLIEDLKWNFSFAILLSESDFPIKPIQGLSEFLSMFPNQNFLAANLPDVFEMFPDIGLVDVFVFCDEFLYRLGQRPWIQNIIYESGSDWIILSHSFMHYISYGDDELIRGLRHTFNYSGLSSETFYHTALINSIHCDTYMRTNLRMVNWDREHGCTCFNNDVIDICGCSPLMYRITDKIKFGEAADKPIFFARKFDATVDERIIDWVDEHVTGIDLSNGSFYLQNIYHIEDSDIQSIDLNELLRIIDFYNRKMIIKQQLYRHLNIIQLEQIHIVFELSVFLGYTFHYTTDNNEQFELFVKQNSNTNIYSKKIKQFDIGYLVDPRDKFFTDRSRTFIEPEIVTVLIEQTFETNEQMLLLMEDSTGTISKRIPVFQFDTSLIIDIIFPEITSEWMTGIWNMYLLSNSANNTLASLNFLILSSNQIEINDQEWSVDTTAVPKFWPIADICSIRTHSPICSNPQYTKTTLPMEIKDCDQQRWSIFYYDIKTNW